MTIPGDSGFLMDNEASCLPCTPAEEKQIIKELTDSSTMSEGDLYFLLSKRWYVEWEGYVTRDEDELDGFSSIGGARPGQIDNRELAAEGSEEGNLDDLEVRRHLQEGIDYVFVSEQVWKKLHDWNKGGPVLPRKVIALGVYHKHFVIEVYPLHLKLIDS